ncbi:MAG: UDP-N-acetylmuramoyl-L-alanyl-D-glutamate--2,6-diaminopimelate ligase [Candidatus Woesebacteria bacterium]|jgi:UDP-N-acetylmuramoyl-L-alanyl-D-glutamate--2,6-diaminopimelate ligase
MIKNIIYRLKRPYHFLKTAIFRGIPAQIKYRFPSKKLKVITITGTDGKTTSSTLTYHILKTAGKKVGLISTVAAYIGDKEIETGLHVTTPDPRKLQQLMREMLNQGLEYLVLEFTSHGAYQYRTWGVKPFIGGLTNITHEHLDYHLNMENYIDAKAMMLKKASTLILNADDKNYLKLRKKFNKKQNIINYSLSEKLPSSLTTAIKKRFPESYNQMNARLAIKIAKLLKIENKDIIRAIESFPGVPGRMQFVSNKKGFEIVIDFAHTPNALEAALTALRKKQKQDKSKGKLIAVYGCAGLRDVKKRPMMGKIGVDLADLVIFTAEDPRTEDVWSIIRQMKEQLEDGHNKIISIADRKKAISFALRKIAKRGDLIAIFGKGPEKSICYGKIEKPWSDLKVVQEILNG